VLKFLDNVPMTAGASTSRLIVKADEKTTAFLRGWIETKKQEWVERQ
jgi:hypothetical protein